ncbi:right-handed parallel beta-helix repeat-containing protein [Stieleria varia]|uniref:Pectate lyase superfamily protein n=1 Tax=Stieleria varia TaxID=2528005 RepID=A0A5C6A243_9BACT|nr:right-handed parallel beta-helix repeat-containing protein [Stieleria varia]TWT93298.1 Pectate lyase superfamily protein [Stieleria varia]
MLLLRPVIAVCFLVLIVSPIVTSPVIAADLVGDGVADDTVAIQAMVDRLKGSVRFPSGTYRITRPIVIDLARCDSASVGGDGRVRLIMDGPGPALDIVGTHDGTAAPQSVRERVWQWQNSPVIADLEIVGNHPESGGVRLAGTMQPTLRDLTIRKTRHAIHLVGRNRNVIVRDCHLYENTGVGLFFDAVNLHQTNITGSHISYNAGGGIVIRGGDVRNVHITGCDIEGNMGDEAAPPAANVWLVSGNGSIGEVAITGCTIQHAHEAADSANIRIDLRSNPVRVTEELRHGNITISGNVLSDTQVNVHLLHARGATINGNTIWKGYHANVLLQDCEAITLTGNAMDRNPRYHYGDGDQAKLGVRLEDCSKCILSANVINGVGLREAALELQGCDDINVLGNTIMDSHAKAVIINDCRKCRVTNCIFENESAIEVKDSQDILVSDNGS